MRWVWTLADGEGWMWQAPPGGSRQKEGWLSVVGASFLTGRGGVRTPLHPGGPHRCPHYAGPRGTKRRMERRGATLYLHHLSLCLSVATPIEKTHNMNDNKHPWSQELILSVREATTPLLQRAINRVITNWKWDRPFQQASFSHFDLPIYHLSTADDAPRWRKINELSAKFPAAHCARVSKGKWRFINRILISFRSPLSLGESRLMSITTHYKMSAYDPYLIFAFKVIFVYSYF